MKITDFGVAVVEHDTHLSKWVVEHGRLDIQDTFCRLFIEYIPTHGVVVDVGACIGDHTLSYSKMVGASGVVHAFEPNPVAFECLARNMIPYRNVVCYRLALGSKEGRAVIANPSELNIGANIIAVTEQSDAPIKVVTLDHVAKDWKLLDFIKIDAEGMEPDILEGAMETIKRLQPVILVEINKSILKARFRSTRDITEPLERCGYHLQPAEPHHSFNMETVDVLCLPAGKVK